MVLDKTSLLWIHLSCKTEKSWKTVQVETSKLVPKLESYYHRNNQLPEVRSLETQLKLKMEVSLKPEMIDSCYQLGTQMT